MIRVRRLLISVAGVALVVACAAEPITNQVDGWATGAFLRECTDRLRDADCASTAGPAVASIEDERTIRTVKIYEEGPYVDADGEPRLIDRGGGPVVVVVVTYTDGAPHAVGVYCGAAVPAASAASASCELVAPPFD